jgi:hypothetical protein
VRDIRWRQNVSLLLVPLLVLGTGCTNGRVGFAALDPRQSPFGPVSMLDHEAWEVIDLALELDPSVSVRGIMGDVPAEQKLEAERVRVRDAFEAFYRNTPVPEQLQRRNRVQERLLAASNQACGEYKNILKRFDAENNTILGWVATAIAGAGAIVTGAGAARALSGVAGILTGARAELNENYFQNKTTQVIADGLDAKRKEDYERIQVAQRQTIVEYPVEAAVKDALTYHTHCSLVAGLEQAALSIERAQNPGIAMLEKTLVQAKRLQAIVETPPADLAGVMATLPTAFSGAAATLSIDGLIVAPAPTALETYRGVTSQIERVVTAFAAKVDEVKSALPADPGKKAERDAVAGPLDAAVKAARDLAALAGTTLAGNSTRAAEENFLRLAKLKSQLIVVKAGTPEEATLRLQYGTELEEGRKIVSEMQKIVAAFSQSLGEARRVIGDRNVDRARWGLKANQALHTGSLYLTTLRRDSVGRQLDSLTADQLKKVSDDGKKESVTAELEKLVAAVKSAMVSDDSKDVPGDAGKFAEALKAFSEAVAGLEKKIADAQSAKSA